MKEWELEYKIERHQFNSIQRYIKRLWNFIHWVSSLSCEYRYRRLTSNEQRATSRGRFRLLWKQQRYCCCCCCCCRNKEDNEKWFYTTLMNLNVLCLPPMWYAGNINVQWRSWARLWAMGDRRTSESVCILYVRCTLAIDTHTNTYAHHHMQMFNERNL